MIRWNRLRMAAIAVASAAALSTGALMAGPASAAQGGNTAASAELVATGSAPAGINGGGIARAGTPSLAATAARGTAVPAIDAADCYTHMPAPSLANGDVTVAAVVNCTKPMRLLEATVDLYWNGIQVEQDIQNGIASVAAAASSPCTPGSYSAKLTLDLVWPVGVSGPPTYTETTADFVTTC
jgi:hypothetical protein